MKNLRKILGWILLVLGAWGFIAMWMPHQFWQDGWEKGALTALVGLVVFCVSACIGGGFVLLVFWLIFGGDRS